MKPCRSTPPPHRAFTLGLALLLGLTACASTGSTGPVILAAASTQVALEQVVQRLGLGAEVSAAGSQVLAAQVRAGLIADVVVLADPELAVALEDEGLAGPAQTLATNGLVILSRDRSLQLADLAAAGLAVVLADAVVPLGTYTRRALDDAVAAGRLSRSEADAIVANADSFEDNASSVLTKLLTGSADAAIVYRSDAVRAVTEDDALFVTTIDAEDAARLTVQVLTDAPDPERAQRLLASLTGPDVAEILREFGFVTQVTAAATTRS